MMRNNNKKRGFTLIELLAVIVILAVIALIAVPQILNILSSARKSAAESSALSIAKSADKYVQDFMMKNYGGFPEETVTFECSKEGCKLQTELTDYNITKLEQLGFQGAKPTGGTVTITEGGNKVTASNLEINGYYCNYDGEKSWCETEYIEPKFGGTVIKKEEFASKGIIGGYEGVLAIIYLDPTDLTKECNEKNSVSTTGTNTGCMKWYAYKEDAQTYTMIADHNITNNVKWYLTLDNTKGPITALEKLQKATSNWDNILVAPGTYTASWTDSNGFNQTYTINYANYGNKSRLISAEEITKIVKGIVLSTQELQYIPNLDPTCGAIDCSIGENKYAWLFDNTEGCTTNGCNVESSGTGGYWTSTKATHSDTSFVVFGTGDLLERDTNDDGDCGLRPVIIVRKSDLIK